MKTLYLHIGTPKTATSSIQSFCRKNKEILEKKGYCYPIFPYHFPMVNRNRNGHFLIARVLNEDGNRNFEKEQAYFRNGMKRVETCFQSCDNVILTDESIWFYSSYVYKDFFQRMIDYAQEHDWTLKVLVYLRRQDQYIASRWNQSVKRKSAMPAAVIPLEEYLEQCQIRQKQTLLYGKKLDAIAAIIGKENLCVRRFDRADWADGSIVHDFVQQIGLTWTEDFVELAEPANLKMGENETELKRLLNKNDNLTSEELLWMGNILRDMSKQEPKTAYAMLTAEETKQLIQRYEGENQYVAEHYIGDGKPLFSDEVKDLPKWTPDNEEMPETLMTFFSTALAEQWRCCEELKKENLQIRKELEKQAEQLKKQTAELKKVKWEFHMFRDKVKHPLRTLLQRIFKRGGK